MGVGAGGAGGECHAAAAAAAALGPVLCSSGGRHGVVAGDLEEGVEPDDEAVQGVDFVRQGEGQGLVGEGEVFFGDGVEGEVEKGVGRSGHGGRFEVLDEDFIADMR